MERKRLGKQPEAETPLPHLPRATWMPASTSPPAQGPHALEGISDPSQRRDSEHSSWTGAGLAMRLPATMRDVLKRYGLALALASLTLFLRSQLPLPVGTAVYQLPIAAVVLSAWCGGRGPGLFASLICATGTLYWFIPPLNSFEVSSDYVPGFSIFIGLCLLLSEFSAGRRRAEHALRASEGRFRTFVDHATDAFFMLDEQLLVVDVNRHACESLGWSSEELIGMHPREFDVGLDEPSIRRLAQRAGAGEIITFETRHRRKDGTAFPVEIRTRTFKQGRDLFYLALARDISERKLAEEALREKDYALQMARTELARVSRLTTLGELTTSIAHEVSQPLGAMIASAAAGARWLAAEPPDMAEARAALDNISADGKRAREVIARIRALTKRQAPRADLLDLNRNILEVLAFTEQELRSHDIVLETRLDSTLPQVTADRVQLQQVLLNVIVNAIEAMSAVNNRPRELTIVSAPGADGVVVEVRDSGIGLDPHSAERVFEAFYTTKTEGIGVGLSISRSIIEAHGGRLWAAPNEPHGAVFRFSLPVAEEVP
jgi:PAS domain S-box-containing protein